MNMVPAEHGHDPCGRCGTGLLYRPEFTPDLLMVYARVCPICDEGVPEPLPVLSTEPPRGVAPKAEGSDNRWDRWWLASEDAPVRPAVSTTVRTSGGGVAVAEMVEADGTFAFRVPGQRVSARARFRLTARRSNAA
jgi:hypothetical protein